MTGREPWFPAIRIAWNYLRSKQHGVYPCGRCGYRYECGDPRGSECHS